MSLSAADVDYAADVHESPDLGLLAWYAAEEDPSPSIPIVLHNLQKHLRGRGVQARDSVDVKYYIAVVLLFPHSGQCRVRRARAVSLQSTKAVLEAPRVGESEWFRNLDDETVRDEF